MTLYELLHKVSFDEIAPFLSKSYAEGRSLAWLRCTMTTCAILFRHPKARLAMTYM